MNTRTKYQNTGEIKKSKKTSRFKTTGIIGTSDLRTVITEKRRGSAVPCGRGGAVRQEKKKGSG